MAATRGSGGGGGGSGGSGGLRGLLPAALGGGPPAEPLCGLTTGQRLQAAAVLLCGACALYSLALLVFLPLVLFAPAKFAASFTFASLFWLAALACVRGPRALAASLAANGNAPVTAAYLASLALSLAATVGRAGYVLALLAAVVQLGAAAWYSASFLPGGTAGMAFLTRAMLPGGARSWLPR